MLSFKTRQAILYFIWISNRTELCMNRPSGFASLPDYFFLNRFAIRGNDGAFIPQSPCLGTRPQTPSPLRDKQKPACMLHHRLAFIGFKSLHFLRNLHQLLTNRQMLRTSPFALAALFARRRPCALIHILPRRFKGKLVVVHRILVHHSEIARDIHPKRTGHAVLTTRAADKYPRR